MKENYVWEFTNQKKLNRKEFIDYFERKIFRTIRRYNMLPKSRVFRLKKSDDLNTKVLYNVINGKLKIELGNTPNISSQNLSGAAEETFENVLKGQFKGPKPDNSPLYYLSDKEVELYARIKGISGKKRKANEKVQALFGKFIKRNQDLEINIVNALEQLRKTSF